MLSRLCLFLLCTAGVAGAAMNPPALTSRVIAWEDLKSSPTPVGAYRAVCDGPTATLERLEVHATTLLPGRTSHPPHTHAQEEFILVREGLVEAFINGQLLRAGPGALIAYASLDRHNLTNVGETPATYLVINFYTAATVRVGPAPAAQAAPPDWLHSGVFPWEKLEAKAAPDGAFRKIVDLPSLTLERFEAHVTTLLPGGSRPPHRRARDELLIIKEGRLDVTAGTATCSVGPGSVVLFASGDLQAVHNAGPEPVSYYLLSVATPRTPREDPQ